MSISAMKMALEAMESAIKAGDWVVDGACDPDMALVALRQAIEQAEKPWVKTYCGGKPNYTTLSDPVVLPDSSAFGMMSYPLPETHWLYAEREYRDGEYEPIELGKPILTHQLRDSVISAVRYAVRGATNCGKEMDFDPDALVQNAVYALCGPYSRSVDAVNMKQERVDETAKGEHEQLLFGACVTCGALQEDQIIKQPPKREWVGLTDIEKAVLVDKYKHIETGTSHDTSLIAETEAKLKEKNT